jgi:acylphosphatase
MADIFKSGKQEASGTDLARLYAVVSGRVQGVGYRYYALDAAQELGLSGWVRNMTSSEVEIVAEGSRHDLMRFLIILERGPHHAVVKNIRVDWSEALDDLKGFRIRY